MKRIPVAAKHYQRVQTDFSDLKVKHAEILSQCGKTPAPAKLYELRVVAQDVRGLVREVEDMNKGRLNIELFLDDKWNAGEAMRVVEEIGEKRRTSPYHAMVANAIEMFTDRSLIGAALKAYRYNLPLTMENIWCQAEKSNALKPEYAVSLPLSTDIYHSFSDVQHRIGMPLAPAEEAGPLTNSEHASIGDNRWLDTRNRTYSFLLDGLEEFFGNPSIALEPMGKKRKK